MCMNLSRRQIDYFLFFIYTCETIPYFLLQGKTVQFNNFEFFCRCCSNTKSLVDNKCMKKTRTKDIFWPVTLL